MLTNHHSGHRPYNRTRSENNHYIHGNSRSSIAFSSDLRALRQRSIRMQQEENKTVSTKASHLFRIEAIEAMGQKGFGRVTADHRHVYKIIALISGLCLAALVATITFAQVNRRTTVSGIIAHQSGSINISSPSSGTTALLVKEGDIVEAGDRLLTVSTDRMIADGSLAGISAMVLKQRLDSLNNEKNAAEESNRRRIQSAELQLSTLAMESTKVDEEIEILAGRIATSLDKKNSHQELARTGYLSKSQMQLIDDELAELKSRRLSLQRVASGIRREIHGQRTVIADAPAQLRSALAQLERNVIQTNLELAENASRKDYSITAPRRARVAAIHIANGNSVQPGQGLLILAPTATDSAAADPLQAELFSPSRSIGFVAPGQEVWIKYLAFPYQKYGTFQGRIKYVTPTPVAPSDLPSGQAQALLSAMNTNEPLYKVTVELQSTEIRAFGVSHAVRPGMAIEADILQERRSIWEFIMEPFLAIRGNGLFTKPQPSPGGTTQDN